MTCQCRVELESERVGASELEDAYAEALGALNAVTAERDRARETAVRLEQENALLTATLDDLRYDARHWPLATTEIVGRITYALERVTL